MVLGILRYVAAIFRKAITALLRALGLQSPVQYRDVPASEVTTSNAGSVHSFAPALELANEAEEPQHKPVLPTSAPADKPRVLVVMRHGHRQDEEEHGWSLAASRPWDPPLSEKGRKQARDAVPGMQRLQVDFVLCSPFLRCLQTSAAIVQGLGVKPGCWQVDWGLSEVCTPRNVGNGNTAALARISNRTSAAEWMWRGMGPAEAVYEFMMEESQHSGVGFKPVWRPSTPPLFPETLEAAMERYKACVRGIMQEFQGSNVLLVGHGECLRQVVKMMEPEAEVYEVKHTGYVLLNSEAGSSSSSSSSQWQLACAPGETGVSWFT